MSMFEKITANWLSFGILFLLILLAVLLLWRTRRPHLQKQPRKDIMPGFTLIYADQKQSGKKSEGFGKLLYSAKYDLQGTRLYFQKKTGQCYRSRRTEKRCHQRRSSPPSRRFITAGSLLPSFGGYLRQTPVLRLAEIQRLYVLCAKYQKLEKRSETNHGRHAENVGGRRRNPQRQLCHLPPLHLQRHCMSLWSIS